MAELARLLPGHAPRSTSDERLPLRLAWVTGLRLVFLSLLLGALALLHLRLGISAYPQTQRIVFFTVGSAYALAAVYATILRSRKHLERLTEVQLVLDQLTWTAIVYVSGGATSGATSFYGLTCLVGAVLIGLRGAAIAATTGAFCFLSLCIGFGFGWLLPPSDQRSGSYEVSWEAMAYPAIVNVIGVLVVAMLAGYLAERLRIAGGALREANARALAAEHLAVLGRIAAGLAHEIRNPLGSISGSIEMLREAPGLTDEDRRLCGIIHRESARLNNLVSDMMDLARPRKPTPEIVDVARLSREVVALASRSERSGAGDVAVRYEGPSTPVWALCDPAQMRQVLWNLVRNAVQASGAGTTVRIVVERNGRRVRFAVADEGPGIDEPSLSKIFDGFYTTRATGAGIGLAVVRKIIDDHEPYGASIDVQSTPNGTSFVVELTASDTRGRADSLDPDIDVMDGANAR